MPTILVIDDDLSIINLVSVVLRMEHYEVRRASNGSEGLNNLSANSRPDLILLDLSMPVMDGRQFYAEARACGYSGPIVVCSAQGAQEACRELGAQAAVPKPFDPDALLAVIALQLG